MARSESSGLVVTSSDNLCPPLPKKRPSGCCLPLSKPPKRPDPAIYSQWKEYSLGKPISWNSPDVFIGKFDADSGLPTPTSTFWVTVRNLSPDTAAAGVYAHVEASKYGIGLPTQKLFIHQLGLNPLAEAKFEVPVPAELWEEWKNISLFIRVSHPQDKDMTNNRGAESSSFGWVKSGQAFSLVFPVHNSLSTQSTFKLSVLESDWSSQLSSETVTLLPGQTQDLTLAINPPVDTTGQKDFNIVALTADDQLYGGIHYRAIAKS